MKEKITPTIQFTTLILLLIAICCSAVFAQPSAGANKYAALRALFEQKQYAEVLKAITPIIEAESKDTSDQNKATLADLYFLRGASRVAFLYRARTGTVFASYAPVERPLFEVKYNPQTTQILQGATADLTRARELKKELEIKNLKTTANLSEIIAFRALANLEKAQFVTNEREDFLTARENFYELELQKNVELSSAGNYTEAAMSKAAQDGWKQEGYLLAARSRALIGAADSGLAFKIFFKWLAATGDEKVKPETALVSMVEAFDMIGGYKQSRGLILLIAVNQIITDKGKFVPENQSAAKIAFKRYSSDLSSASKIIPSETMLPYERARLAGALDSRGNLTAAEKEFVVKSMEIFLDSDKNLLILDALTFSNFGVLNYFQPTPNSTENRKLIGEIIETHSAPTIPKFANLLNTLVESPNGLQKMEEYLTEAIKKDMYFAYTSNAFLYRAEVYKLQGKPDLAAKDEKQAAQFNDILKFLAQP